MENRVFIEFKKSPNNQRILINFFDIKNVIECDENKTKLLFYSSDKLVWILNENYDEVIKNITKVMKKIYGEK